MYRLLCECNSFFLWDQYPGMELLDCIIVAFLVSQESAKPLPRLPVPFYIFTSNVSVSLHLCQHLVMSQML